MHHSFINTHHNMTKQINPTISDLQCRHQASDQINPTISDLQYRHQACDHHGEVTQ